MASFRNWVAAAALAAMAAAVSPARAGIVNGDFETNSLAPWTTFATANGTTNSPSVTSFDTTGSGASLAATFQVGELSFTGLQEGGGIFQTFAGGAGDYTVSVDVAAFNPNILSFNAEGGVFSLLFNSSVIDTFTMGGINSNQTIRHTLTGTVAGVAAGTQEVRILITRPYITDSTTPIQYVDNVTVGFVPATLPTTSVPEPSTLALAGTSVLLGLAAVARRRKPATA